MSWDIFVQDIPPSARRTEDIPHDFDPAPLGVRADIIRSICEVVPSANFEDPAWGTIDGPDFSIEVNLGNEPVVDGFAFHVRGSGDAVAVISDILEHLGVRALDPGSESGLFEPRAARESFERWRTYRDQIAGRA